MTTQTVLIIEDEPSLQEILTYNLESRGYHVLVFDEGTEGLEGVRKHIPDIVLLDIMLPGMDGFEVCRHIRSDPLIKHLPVLMMTARGEEIDQLVGFQMGADDYVTKPFKMRILLERTQACLRRTEVCMAYASGRLSADGIVLDRIQFKATIDGEDIAFTPTEFDLLWHLMKHPGRVFNRADLMNAIMGDDTIVLERTIDVHIRALRKKLGGCGDFIETVHGIGYRYKNE